jgi:OOP family OmpA-OmpF porin
MSGAAEFWWLRQPDNPLTLRWRFAGDDVQVVRIDSPQPKGALEARAAAGLESDACRAELHGVYFDTGSATLLRASDAALESVAALLREHAGWQLTVEGHTDAIGSDAANQDLSERRAAAVRAALIDRFGPIRLPGG